MALITGTVKKIQQREVNGKFGPATAYNLGVEQDGQSELTWIGAGFKSPGVREESRVTIMATQNNQGYWQCKPENIEVLGVAQVATQAPSAQETAQTQAPAPAPRPANNDRQSSITLQTAHKVAADVVGMMLANGILKPTVNSKPKQETAQDMVVAYVERLAARFHKSFNNPDEFIEDILSDAGRDAVDESDSDMFEDD